MIRHLSSSRSEASAGRAVAKEAWCDSDSSLKDRMSRTTTASSATIARTLTISRRGSFCSGMAASVVEHLDGRGLIAQRRREESPKLLLRLILGGCALGRFKALRPTLRGDGRGQIGELLRLKRQELVTRLGRLECASRTLARPDKRRHLGPIRVEVADDPGLNAQGILQAGHGVLPACLRVGDQRLVRLACRCRRVGRRKRLIDLLDIKGDPLRLPEELLRTLSGLLKLL